MYEYLQTTPNLGGSTSTRDGYGLRGVPGVLGWRSMEIVYVQASIRRKE
jgi:hypothetical protein